MAPTSGRPASHHPTDALHVAADRMYAAFEAIPFDAGMPRDPGTVNDIDMASIAGSVPSLPASTVARFVVKAGTTWGGPDDFRRIAPRALELAADLELPVDRGLLWAKMRWAGWTDWPTYQTTTVREFLRSEWARLLRADPRPSHVGHRWLRYAADGLDDLGPYLDEWHVALDAGTPAPHRRAATGHLVILLVNSPLRPDHPATVHDVFPAHPDAAEQLTRWLTDPVTTDRLSLARYSLAGTSDARRVGVALERLIRFGAAVRRTPTRRP
jgi:hypothetical protein